MELGGLGDAGFGGDGFRSRTDEAKGGRGPAADGSGGQAQIGRAHV